MIESSIDEITQEIGQVDYFLIEVYYYPNQTLYEVEAHMLSKNIYHVSCHNCLWILKEGFVDRNVVSELQLEDCQYTRFLAYRH